MFVKKFTKPQNETKPHIMHSFDHFCHVKFKNKQILDAFMIGKMYYVKSLHHFSSSLPLGFICLLPVCSSAAPDLCGPLKTVKESLNATLRRRYMVKICLIFEIIVLCYRKGQY